MRRLICVIALSAGLCVAGTAAAQPRPGGPGPDRKDGPDVRRLEAQLERLSGQLKEMETRLARMQSPPAPRDEPRGGGAADRGPRSGGPPFGRLGDRGPGAPFSGRGPGFGRGEQGIGRFGPDGPRGSGSPGGLRGPGAGGSGGDRGPGAGASPDIARRLDRIINELEELKRDLQSQRR